MFLFQVKKFFVIFVFFLCAFCRAESSPEHTELVHGVAHIAGVYTLSNLSYGFYKKTLGMKKLDALILSSLTGLTFSYVYQTISFQHDNSIGHFNRGMNQNILGTVLFVGTTLVFDF